MDKVICNRAKKCYVEYCEHIKPHKWNNECKLDECGETGKLVECIKVKKKKSKKDKFIKKLVNIINKWGNDL